MQLAGCTREFSSKRGEVLGQPQRQAAARQDGKPEKCASCATNHGINTAGNGAGPQSGVGWVGRRTGRVHHVGHTGTGQGEEMGGHSGAASAAASASNGALPRRRHRASEGGADLAQAAPGAGGGVALCMCNKAQALLVWAGQADGAAAAGGGRHVVGAGRVGRGIGATPACSHCSAGRTPHRRPVTGSRALTHVHEGCSAGRTVKVSQFPMLQPPRA